MSLPVKILPHYTYDEYCLWEGRWELIDGIPYAMSPAPIPGHQLTGGKLITQLNNALQKANCRHCKVYQFIDVKIEEDTIVQPDVLIVGRPIEKKFLDFPATLVVEILSPATALKDRHVKLSLYEKMGIKYFLIVDIEKRSIEINTLDNNEYHLTNYPVGQPFQFILEDNCSIDVDLNNIWE